MLLSIFHNVYKTQIPSTFTPPLTTAIQSIILNFQIRTPIFFIRYELDTKKNAPKKNRIRTFRSTFLKKSHYVRTSCSFGPTLTELPRCWPIRRKDVWKHFLQELLFLLGSVMDNPTGTNLVLPTISENVSDLR